MQTTRPSIRRVYRGEEEDHHGGSVYSGTQARESTELPKPRTRSWTAALSGPKPLTGQSSKGVDENAIAATRDSEEQRSRRHPRKKPAAPNRRDRTGNQGEPAPQEAAKNQFRVPRVSGRQAAGAMFSRLTAPRCGRQREVGLGSSKTPLFWHIPTARPVELSMKRPATTEAPSQTEGPERVQRHQAAKETKNSESATAIITRIMRPRGQDFANQRLPQDRKIPGAQARAQPPEI